MSFHLGHLLKLRNRGRNSHDNQNGTPRNEDRGLITLWVSAPRPPHGEIPPQNNLQTGVSLTWGPEQRFGACPPARLRLAPRWHLGRLFPQPQTSEGQTSTPERGGTASGPSTPKRATPGTHSHPTGALGGPRRGGWLRQRGRNPTRRGLSRSPPSLQDSGRPLWTLQTI